jgi:hypothetical protein
MREEQIVNIFGVESQFAVSGIGLHTFALIHATIEQNGLARIGGDEVFATCHLPSSAKKLNEHNMEGLLSYFFTNSMPNTSKIAKYEET